MSEKDRKILLELKNLKKYFPLRQGLFVGEKKYIRAVDDISLHIHRGETLGLVGESGCGKSTMARTIIRLYEPTAGKVIFNGAEIGMMSEKQFKPIRKKMQMIFQDPYSSLNSCMTVGDIIGEALDIHGLAFGKSRMEMIHGLLDRVGLNPDHALRYPHEFSGGQRQRIGIARALAVNPEFIICDEPISSLDVSIQAQVINMLEDLQAEMGMTYLFISHDLAMVRYVSHRIAVMYLGKIMEIAEVEELYGRSVHPYTQALLSSIAIPDPKLIRSRKRILLDGDVPSPMNPPPGCRFHTRCKYAMAICSEMEPLLKELGGSHRVACHLY